jgi:hypothetical protein
MKLGVSTKTTLHINNTNMTAMQICEVGVTHVPVIAGCKVILSAECKTNMIFTRNLYLASGLTAVTN